ncbi:MAG: diguanylate cyclase domain-containing protein, partial [Sedimentibacter sp.]
MCNRILLIDDEKIIRDALEKRLIVDGYEVCVAEDGLYGLSLLEKKEKDDAGFFDIVILNVEMPKMSGVDVLRLIKEKYANVEVIVTTNIKSVDIAIKVLRLGAFDYIQKPIEYNKLSLAILSAIEKKEKNQKSKVAEKAMRSNEGKCRSIVEHASDGIAIIQDNLFKYVNPQFEQLMGCSEDLLLETSLFKYVHPNFLDKMMDYFIYDKIGNHQTVMITNSGNEVKIELNTSEIMYGERKAQLVIFRDVTERKKTEDKMEFLTFHDKLTGLYNRAFFDEEIKRLDTNRQLPLSIIMADLNSLKLTNDGLGHLVGDELIIQAANALKRACRAEEIISRWGGDEFVILLPKVSEDDANAICERINEKCESISNLPIKVSMALGTASKTTATQNIENILKEAEDNMYKNKLLN